MLVHYILYIFLLFFIRLHINDYLSSLPLYLFIKSLARIVLIQPLIQTSMNARSSYLKSESFRFLSELYHNVIPKKNKNQVNVGAESNDLIMSSSVQECIQCGPSIISSITTTLLQQQQQQKEQTKDVTIEVMKSKRIRDVLKACEQYISFLLFIYHQQSDNDNSIIQRYQLELNKTTPSSSPMIDLWNELFNQLSSFHNTSPSTSIQSVCMKLMDNVKSVLDFLKKEGCISIISKKEIIKMENRKDDEKCSDDDDDDKEVQKKSKKKKKKKKKQGKGKHS